MEKKMYELIEKMYAELQETKANMASKDDIKDMKAIMATKDELNEIRANMATKDELNEIRANMATKDELNEIRANMATKDELNEIRANMATKDDIKRIEQNLAEIEHRHGEKLSALFDARETQKEINEKIISTLARIEAKVDVLQMETAHVRRIK